MPKEKQLDAVDASFFHSSLALYINNLVEGGMVEAVFVEATDVVNQTAIVNVIKNDLTEVRYFIDRDENNDLRHRLIVI